MSGIYNDSFISFLKENLKDNVKITGSNIICRCPWCEINKNKKHYHLYISLEAPIFRCFHSDCQEKGTVRKLVTKICGIDNSKEFVDEEKIKQNIKRRIVQTKIKCDKEIFLPELKEDLFINKTLYMKKRIGFSNIPLSNFKGLIFDINEFLDKNNISNLKIDRLKDFLHSNFIGFLTENKSCIVFRNLDQSSDFRYFKYKIHETKFLDYYKIQGNYNSNTIVLSEGIFDIIIEQINNTINSKSNCLLYAAGLSSAYESLIKSIIFHEQIFRPDVIILSDLDVNINYYKRIKSKNNYIINSLTLYYNSVGKDFGELNVIPKKIVL